MIKIESNFYLLWTKVMSHTHLSFQSVLYPEWFFTPQKFSIKPNYMLYKSQHKEIKQKQTNCTQRKELNQIKNSVGKLLFFLLSLKTDVFKLIIELNYRFFGVSLLICLNFVSIVGSLLFVVSNSKEKKV